MRVTIMVLLFFWLIKRNYIIFDISNFLFDANQNATFSLLTHQDLSNFLALRYATFLTILYL